VVSAVLLSSALLSSALLSSAHFLYESLQRARNESFESERERELSDGESLLLLHFTGSTSHR